VLAARPDEDACRPIVEDAELEAAVLESDVAAVASFDAGQIRRPRADAHRSAGNFDILPHCIAHEHEPEGGFARPVLEARVADEQAVNVAEAAGVLRAAVALIGLGWI